MLPPAKRILLRRTKRLQKLPTWITTRSKCTIHRICLKMLAILTSLMSRTSSNTQMAKTLSRSITASQANLTPCLHRLRTVMHSARLKSLCNWPCRKESWALRLFPSFKATICSCESTAAAVAVEISYRDKAAPSTPRWIKGNNWCSQSSHSHLAVNVWMHSMRTVTRVALWFPLQVIKCEISSANQAPTTIPSADHSKFT